VAAVSDLLIHITTRAEWADGSAIDAYGPDRANGREFLHLSTSDQVAATANALFAGRHDLWLLVVDPSLLATAVRWEAGDPPAADGSRFPHLYAPLPAEAVVAVVAYAPGNDGSFHPPTGLPRFNDGDQED
jgi:uncharacterized protein (DUF952 family)